MRYYPFDKSDIGGDDITFLFYLNFWQFFVSKMENVVGCITDGLRMFFLLYFFRGMTQKSFLCDVRYREIQKVCECLAASTLYSNCRNVR